MARQFTSILILALLLSTCSTRSGDHSDATGSDGRIYLNISDARVDETSPCQPFSVACQGFFTIAICDETGYGYTYTVCADGDACLEGSCVPVICEPGELENICLGPDFYSVCNGNGTAWITGYCDEGLKCYDGECVDLACPPGEKACVGPATVQECLLQDDGVWAWQEVEECGTGICEEGACVSGCEATLKDYSYLGCEYWAVDLDNTEGGQDEPVALVVSNPADAPHPATVGIFDMSKLPPHEMTSQALGVDDMTVSIGGLKVFTLPSAGHELEESVLSMQTFRLQADSPVTVHQFNPLNGEKVYSNDASLLLPSHVGGLEYLVMSWPTRKSGYTFRSTAAVVATQDGTTTIEIWPTADIMKGEGVPSMTAQEGHSYTISLEQGQVLNMQTTGLHLADLTGTRIVSDQPIAVFGGHECGNVPLTPKLVHYCDHLEQQLFPVHAWGTTVVGDSFKARDPHGMQKDTWRILAAEDGTTVTLDPPIEAVPKLDRGEFYEFETGKDFLVEASAPILLGHYLHGAQFTGNPIACGQTGVGDPAFTLGVPVEQYLEDFIFLTPDDFDHSYINIIYPESVPGDIVVDGATLSELTAGPGVETSSVGESTWLVSRLPVAPGTHTISSPVPVGVTAYGYDCDVSYAYPGGLSLREIQSD